MKYKDDQTVDWDKLAVEYDESLIRMRDELEALDCSDKEKEKLRKQLNKLLDHRGIPR